MRVTPTIDIPESELSETFVRSPGPGGQNVNKVATAVRLRFDVRRSPSLPEGVRERLTRLAGRKMTGTGEIVIEAHRFRTRERNRADARERLADLVRRAVSEPRARRRTAPPAASRERRLSDKRRLGEVKKTRRPVSGS